MQITIVEFAAGDTHIKTKGDFFGGSMTKTLANAHALFCGLKLEASYLARLDIGDNARANLMAARAKARTVLKLAADNIRFEDRYWRDEWHSAARRAMRGPDRKSTRLNSSHSCASRMPSSARKKNKI